MVVFVVVLDVDVFVVGGVVVELYVRLYNIMSPSVQFRRVVLVVYVLPFVVDVEVVVVVVVVYSTCFA